MTLCPGLTCTVYVALAVSIWTIGKFFLASVHEWARPVLLPACSAPVEALSQYELERLQRIEANMKQLRALGVLEAAAELKAESSRKKERRGWSSEKTKSQAAAGPWAGCVAGREGLAC